MLVDPDVVFGIGLMPEFTSEGFTIDLAVSGHNALSRIDKVPPDLLIVELGLPDFSGPDLCRILRQSGATRNAPLLFLSERATDQDRLQCFAAGADDVAAKTISTAELIARVKALLRRQHAASGKEPNSLAMGDIIVDRRTRRVFRGERQIPLSAKAYSILDYLISRPGQVISRTRLARVIWRDQRVSERVVDVNIHRLRKAIAPRDQEELIATIQGEGYSWVDAAMRLKRYDAARRADSSGIAPLDVSQPPREPQALPL